MTNVIGGPSSLGNSPRAFFGYMLVLSLSLLMMLGVFRVTGGLKNTEHRTDAVLALLALLGALLPLVVSVLGNL
jgi:hypothetical protein